MYSCNICFVIKTSTFAIRAGSHWVSSPKSQVTLSHSMQSQLLRAWELRLTTSHMVPSPNCDMDAYMTTFLKRGWGLVLQVGLSKRLDPTLNPSPENIFAWNNQDPTLMTFNHMLTITWGSQVGTLPPCWDLLTWVGLRTWDPMWTNPWSKKCLE
jgi:hypothetical protein